MKIGDVLPCAGPIDREAIRLAKSRRGQLQRAEARGQSNQHISQAKVILAGMQARDAREADPVEQAKTHLRRRGLNVYDGTVRGMKSGTYFVGTRLRTEAELLALAKRQGWKRR